MKKIMLVFLVSVLGFSGTLYARVQEKSTAGVPPQRIEVFSGCVVCVNPMDREVIVRDMNDEEVTVTVDEETRFFRSGKKTVMNGLRKGKNVTIQCRVLGTDVIAQEIKQI